MAPLLLTREAYRDKVEGGWLGKNAGTTLGAGVAGQPDAHGLTFYDPLPGQPAASEEMDLQLAALSVLRDVGPGLSVADLAEAWSSHITYSFDEIGYARRNIRRGLRPPITGAFDNWFRRSSAAASRTLLWAMVAPGAPQVACAYAFEDARIDHSGEGVWAAMFWAAIQSAAFFVSDARRLLDVGLAMVPQASRVAQAVKAAREAHAGRLSWLEARTAVLKAVGSSNYSDAPQNVGFGAIGLLYGGGDFGASICAAVNCGCDSDGVGGTVGGLLGIVAGRSGLPARWLEPIGEAVVMGWGLTDLTPEATVAELAEHTVEVGERVVAERCADVSLVDELPVEEVAAPPVPEPVVPAEPPAEPADAISTEPAVTDAQPGAEAAAEPEVSAGDAAVAKIDADAGDATTVAPVFELAPEGEAPAAQEGDRSAQPAGTAPAQAAPAVEAEPVLPTPEPVRRAPAGYNWAANSDVRALLTLPASSSTHRVGSFDVTVDYGDNGPAIVPNVAISLTVTVRNRGESPFVGHVQLGVPKGWEARVPGAQGQRQMLAAGGMARYGFVVRAPETATVKPRNELALVLVPETGPASTVSFSLLGGAGWHVVGPFKNSMDDGFERAFEPEDKPGLDCSYLGRAGGLIKWTRMAFKEVVMDLESLFDGQPGVLYARTRLHVPTVTDCRIVFHTNDGGKVWLNSRMVLQRHWHAQFRPTLGDGPCMVDVTLKAGDNDLMLKVVRCREPLEVALMVVDRQARPLEDCMAAWA